MKTRKNTNKSSLQTKRNSHLTRIKTFYCGYSKFMPKNVRTIFDKWQELTLDDVINNKKCDLVILDGWDMFDKKFWNISSVWKSRISAPMIVNKYLLHQVFNNQFFIPTTYFIGKSLPNIQFKSPNDVWIWRTDNKIGRNTDVEILTKYSDLISIYNNFIKKKSLLSKYSTNALLTRYITNPDLIENNNLKYKYHIRIYYILVIEPDIRRAGVYNIGEIPLAQDPYKPNDFKNRRIHETHFSYNNIPGVSKIFNKENFKNYNQIFNSIINILQIVSKKLLPTITGNAESYINFQILGCDFLVDDNQKVWLLEINNSPAIREIDWLQNMLLNGIMEFVINYNPDTKLTNVIKL
jgi:hypothetical protein